MSGAGQVRRGKWQRAILEHTLLAVHEAGQVRRSKWQQAILKHRLLAIGYWLWAGQLGNPGAQAIDCERGGASAAVQVPRAIVEYRLLAVGEAGRGKRGRESGNVQS